MLTSSMCAPNNTMVVIADSLLRCAEIMNSPMDGINVCQSFCGLRNLRINTHVCSHVHALLKIAHDLCDSSLEVMPPAKVSLVRASRGVEAHVASRSSLFGMGGMPAMVLVVTAAIALLRRSGIEDEVQD
jgi:hypothetical protein